MLPLGVWSALGGVVVGSLSLGEDGIMFAAASCVAVFLRAVCSDRVNGEALFGERLITRMAISVICGFVAAIYGWFVDGFSELTLLFGLSMIILPPVLVFLFSGTFSSGVTLRDLLSSADLFSSAQRDESELYNSVFFRISTLSFLFFITLSLGKVEFFGISAAYVFCAAATLLIAKRFGALHALTAGFVSALGISGAYSVSFALIGLGAGIMFSFGTGYALIAGGVLMSAWSVYYADLLGFLTTFPEYVIASVLVLPTLKKISSPERDAQAMPGIDSAEDMVGTMALAYRNEFSGSLDLLSGALSSAASAVRSFASLPSLSVEDYGFLVTDVAESVCEECHGKSLCVSEGICPARKNASALAEKLFSGEKICASDVNTDTEFCAVSGLVASTLNREATRLCNCRSVDREWEAEVYSLISSLISDAAENDARETSVDDGVTDMLTKVVKDAGIEDGVIRAFGERRRHIILACEDADGGKISSNKVRRGIESALGVRLGEAEYFRRGRMALMECDAARNFSVTVAFKSRAGSETEVSGDSSVCFESRDDKFFSLISDGMGKGDTAKATSGFVTDFMRRALELGADKETVIRLANGIIRSRGTECSATVDLFELDLISGESTFVKSGAASSYVKRDSSIFRIRSRTAPIGLMKTIDAEKIRVEIRDGDYVIMLSDGIVDSFDDAPWLLEFLSRDVSPDVSEYAREILDLAVKNATSGDDMSVTVMKIVSAP
jgi:stage II sporulation protein E